MIEKLWTLHFPYAEQIKADEKKKLIDDAILGFKSAGASEVGIVDTYYVSELSEAGMTTFVIVLSAIADVVSVAMAIRTILKSREKNSEILLETPLMKVRINANMSDEAIVKIVKEVSKTLEK